MRTALDIALALWLAASLGFWFFGLAYAGEPFLPALNLFNLLVLYAPWLVLLAASIKALRQRRKNSV